MAAEFVEITSKRSVAQNARHLSALRFGALRSLQGACYWLINVEDIGVKLALGRLVWDLACTADVIGKRTDELRGPEHWTLAGTPEYAQHVRSMLIAQNGLDSLLVVIVPDLIASIENHLSETSPLGDAETVSAIGPLVERLRVSSRAWHETGAETRGQSSLPSASEVELGNVDNPFDMYVREPSLLETSLDPLVEGWTPPLMPGRPGSLALGKPRPWDSAEALLHFVATGIEVAAAEICASIIVQHPRAPWELQRDMARQVFDECRHAELLSRRLGELGAA